MSRLVARAALLAGGLAVWSGGAGGASAASAQSTTGLLNDGIRAYRNLEFELAAGLLRREVAILTATDAPAADQKKALLYLGAADLFRGRRDSATAVFRRLVQFDPRYRPDRLIFPPEVTALFEGVRQETKTMAIVAPRDTQIAAGKESFNLWLVASSFQNIEVTVRHPDGAVFRSLYTGPIGDSLKVQWDGLDAAGAPPAVERLVIRISSRAPSGELVGVRQMPLELRVLRPDTLPLPPPLPASRFLPERSSGRPAVRALMGGAIVSAVVVSLPAIVGGSEGGDGRRLAVAGTVGLAGVVGFILHRPGRPMPANIRANDEVRQAWRQRAASVAEENARLLRNARLVIRTGEPTLMQARGP